MADIYYKLPLTLRYYLLSAFYRLVDSWRLKAIIILTIFLLILSFLSHIYLFLIGLLIWLMIFLFVPSYKYIMGVWRYKYKEMEIFLSGTGVGYKLGDYKLEVDKSSIRSIILLKNRMHVDIISNGVKQNMYFMIDPEDVVMIKRKLNNSIYKDLIN